MMLGRNRSLTEIPKLKFSNYRGVLPTPPVSADYSAKAAKSLARVYANDRYGDCVLAAGYHVRGVTSANADGEKLFTDQQVLEDYRIVGGGGDNGANLADALNFWQKTGFKDGAKVLGWLAVDATDQEECRQACWMFENLYFGIECPNRWFNPMPQQSGFTWDVAGQPIPDNGHCIAGVGYDASGVKVSTWGMLGTLTWGAVSHYCVRNSGGELYVMVCDDMIGKAQQKAPNGLTWHELITDFNAMGGNLPVPPDLKPQVIDWSDVI